MCDVGKGLIIFSLYIHSRSFLNITPGTIRTGTQVMWGAKRSDDEDHQTTAYAYADTLLAYNLYLACTNSPDTTAAAAAIIDEAARARCTAMQALLQGRRAKFPLLQWDDAKVGRLADWPALSS